MKHIISSSLMLLLLVGLFITFNHSPPAWAQAAKPAKKEVKASTSPSKAVASPMASDQLQADLSEKESTSMLVHVFGFSMWPLWIMSVIIVGLVFERRKGLKRSRVIDDSMLESVQVAVQQGDISKAVSLCENSPTVLGNAWSHGLKEYQLGGASFSQALTDASLIALKPLKQNLQSISTIGNIAPLLGLLGTIGGMIMTFNQIAATGGADKAALAEGIAIALLTTGGGLIVAIPAIVSSRYFNQKLLGYAETIEYEIHRINYRHQAFKNNAGDTPAENTDISTDNNTEAGATA